ncbi:hypothetical protein SK128_011483 [Halocaridina rubra]|uniref:Uncharacterized protein n=1 Tax=Halocaridina rubra TaxID=373956 RepID=A0AAN9ABI8_HALRR
MHFSAQNGAGGGVSRAPTLGARTPIPIHEGMGGGGGAASIGPMGGASVAATNMSNTMGLMESSEEEMDRPYQLPRPKSRGSLAVGTLAGQRSRVARIMDQTHSQNGDDVACVDERLDPEGNPFKSSYHAHKGMKFFQDLKNLAGKHYTGDFVMSSR